METAENKTQLEILQELCKVEKPSVVKTFEKQVKLKVKDWTDEDMCQFEIWYRKMKLSKFIGMEVH